MIKIINNYLQKIKRRLKFEQSKIEIKKLRETRLEDFSTCENLILLLVPSSDIINGGLLSLNTIFREINNGKIINQEILCVSCKYDVEGAFVRFTKFDNEIFVYDFKTVLDKLKNIKSLRLFIADVYLENFLFEFRKKWRVKHRNYFNRIEEKSICILNQNDLLMPKLDVLNMIRQDICDNICMTMAHRQYANFENRLKYDMPIHYLSAWLNPGHYKRKLYHEKQNIIVISPDELCRAGIESDFTKDMLINMLKLALPDYQIVIIDNMLYQDYKLLMAEAKFAISLGEGLDGYFIEEVLSGGISFAVFNEVFFPEEYKKLPTVYENYNTLISKIVADIQFYDNNLYYDEYHIEMLKVVEIDYKFEKFQERVKNMLEKKFDFP